MAGRPDIDDALASELEAAGIEAFRLSLLKDGSREVDTEVRGGLHGWRFERAWYYWRCTGPGIEVAAAERLHASHGKDVRVAGHCGCPSPTEWHHSLAVDYHVDTPAGLKALADTIKALVNRAKSPSDPSSTRNDVTVEAKHLVSSARAFLAHFDPCDLAEDKSQQWQSLEHQCNRVERALLDQFDIRRKK